MFGGLKGRERGRILEGDSPYPPPMGLTTQKISCIYRCQMVSAVP